MLKYPYFEDLIRDFYSNMRITNDGNLYYEVNKKRIVITPSDWMTLPHLKYKLKN